MKTQIRGESSILQVVAGYDASNRADRAFALGDVENGRHEDRCINVSRSFDYEPSPSDFQWRFDGDGQGVDRVRFDCARNCPASREEHCRFHFEDPSPHHAHRIVAFWVETYEMLYEPERLGNGLGKAFARDLRVGPWLTRYDTSTNTPIRTHGLPATSMC